MVVVCAEEAPQLCYPEQERMYCFCDNNGTVRLVTQDQRGGTDAPLKEELEEGVRLHIFKARAACGKKKHNVVDKEDKINCVWGLLLGF